VKVKRHGGGMRKYKTIKEKKEYFSRMHLNRSTDNIEW
jgi:hypothetical protein